MLFKSKKKKPKVRKWELEEKGSEDDEKDDPEEPDVNSEEYKKMLKELEEQEERDRKEEEKKASERAKKEAEEARKKAEEIRKKAQEKAEKEKEKEEAARLAEEKERRQFQMQIEMYRKLPNPAVFLDVEAEGENDPLRPAASLKPFRGRLVFELFRDVLPMTSENFRKLCTGELGNGLHFKGNHFHRIIPGFMAQAGDITHGDGTGGMSIYGPKFPDESFIHKHKWPGMLSMANSGPDSNGSQFYITLKKCNWLDGKHVVFGQIKDGLSTLMKIGKAGTKGEGMPKQLIRIVDCGEIDREAVESLRMEDRKKARRLGRGKSPSPIRKSERWLPGSNGKDHQSKSNRDNRDHRDHRDHRDRERSRRRESTSSKAGSRSRSRSRRRDGGRRRNRSSRSRERERRRRGRSSERRSSKKGSSSGRGKRRRTSRSNSR